MITLHQPSDLAARRVCLAIGMFDGVHLGHQQVLRQTLQDARLHQAAAAAVTFDRHPGSIVAPERAPKLIYSLPQKLRALAATGMDATLLIPFTREFSQQPAEVFVRSLAAGFGSIASVCVGATFAFGYKRAGNVALLKNLGAELGFSVHGLSSVQLDGRKVSSTNIRACIESGALDAAQQMLGRPYALAGMVRHGDELGRTLGTPTANLEATGRALPPRGVYAARACQGNQSWPAAVNIGLRPTMAAPAPELRVEAHLIDFSGDLYGQELELVFLRKIREEQRFASREALQHQIQSDIREVRLALGPG